MKLGDVMYSDVFGSHVIALAAATARTTGPIIEIGAGEYSTPMLDEIARATDRMLVTVERQRSWSARFESMRSPSHMFTASLEEGIDACARFSVALVDGDAGDRARAIAALRSKCRFVVVHDTDPTQQAEGHYPGLPAALALYKYRYDFDRGEPWTTVVSDVTPW